MSNVIKAIDEDGKESQRLSRSQQVSELIDCGPLSKRICKAFKVEAI